MVGSASTPSTAPPVKPAEMLELEPPVAVSDEPMVSASEPDPPSVEPVSLVRPVVAPHPVLGGPAPHKRVRS
jgi:hypothetical protein